MCKEVEPDGDIHVSADYQCGFCTPGFLLTLVFLRDTPRPTEQEIREGLAGNLCRCTGYQNIVKAVAAAASALAGGAHPEFWPPQVRRAPRRRRGAGQR